MRKEGHCSLWERSLQNCTEATLRWPASARSWRVGEGSLDLRVCVGGCQVVRLVSLLCLCFAGGPGLQRVSAPLAGNPVVKSPTSPITVPRCSVYKFEDPLPTRQDVSACAGHNKAAMFSRAALPVCTHICAQIHSKYMPTRDKKRSTCK